MRIDGYWYHGSASTATPAKLVNRQDGTVQFVDAITNDELWSCEFKQIHISDQLGNIPRRLKCDHNQEFVTRNNEGINNLMQQYGIKSRRSFLHILERNWVNALIALIISTVLIGIFAVKGVPVIADYAAEYVPDNVVEYVSDESMAYFDRMMFSPSRMSVSRQRELRQYLLPYSNVPVTIEFRSAGFANAFALPSGTIVFTDEFIHLAEHDEEILAVFLHELGHVHYKHGLKSVIQSSIWSIMIALWVGDANALAEALLTLPVVLTQSAFSRQFENQSDDYAYQKMLEHNIDLNRFADIMQRLMHRSALQGEIENGNTENAQNDSKDGQTDIFFQYLSTHPPTKARIQKFRQGAKTDKIPENKANKQ